MSSTFGPGRRNFFWHLQVREDQAEIVHEATPWWAVDSEATGPQEGTVPLKRPVDECTGAALAGRPSGGVRCGAPAVDGVAEVNGARRFIWAADEWTGAALVGRRWGSRSSSFPPFRYPRCIWSLGLWKSIGLIMNLCIVD